MRRVPSPADCLTYAEAVIKQKPAFLPALRELLRLEVCSRCCLRYAGVRADVYATPAPVTSRLCEALEQAVGSKKRSSLAKPVSSPIQPASPVCEREILPEESSPSKHSLPQSSTAQLPQSNSDDLQQNGLDTSNAAQSVARELNGSQAEANCGGSAEGTADLPEGNNLEKGQAASSHDPACRVCLGILQSLDGPLQSVPPEELLHLSERDGGGSPWSPVRHGDAVSIADHIRALNYACHGIAIELSLPASTQLRQLAMWYHLKTLPETSELFPGSTLRDDVVDLKESLRLRGVITDPIAEALGKPLDPRDGDLRLTLNYIHPSSASESDFLFGRPFKGRSQKKRRKRTVVDVGRSSSETVVAAAGKWSIDKFRQEFHVPPRQPTEGSNLMVAARRLPLYIGGMYRKLQRDVSQSPWTIDGQKKGRTSVQEEIERVLLSGLRCDGCKFITAGREDIDVRMLGKGRPFVMEIQNQRAEMPGQDYFSHVEQQLQESGVGVEVRCLQPVSKEKLQAIKEGEQSKQKSYEAICKLPCEVTQEIVDKINSCRDLLLAQNTPQRVAHRRALLVRERMVYTMHCQPMEEDKTLLKLNLRTQAGTYIKEFVHGDEGRTEPNLGSFLGCTEAAAILQLDVLEIHMDFLGGP